MHGDDLEVHSSGFRSNASNDALSPGEIARREWINDTANAWRTDDARALRMTPPPGGYYPKEAGVGTTCNLNGEAGVLQPDPDGTGFLVCKVISRIGPTRADAAPPRTMSAEDAQLVRDQAWREYVGQTQNALRG
jgi:hypothetical protein